jgi:hypothetical protein
MWSSISEDKILLHTLLDSLQAPTPKIHMVYHRSRDFRSPSICRSENELTEYLRIKDHYPFFSKTVWGLRSLGVASVASYDESSDTLVLADGRTAKVQEFARQVSHFTEFGYLFQEVLRPHPDIAEVCGDRLVAVRLMIFLTEDGPEVFNAAWKIPVGDNVADNFWRPGNMLAHVDLKSGRVLRVVQGVGPDQVEVDSHPDTGKRLLDFVLPDWEKLKALCLRLAPAVPGLRYQAWDVALCPDGPVILELNNNGGAKQIQTPTGKGILNERFFELFEIRKAALKSKKKNPLA